MTERADKLEAGIRAILPECSTSIEEKYWTKLLEDSK